MLLDLPFAFEVGDPCLPVRAADGAVDEVLYSRRLRRIRERFSLLDLAFGAGLQEVLHGEDAVSVFERLRLRLLRIAGERTDPKASIEEASRHGASLLAGRPSYHDQAFCVLIVGHVPYFSLF